MQQSKGVKVVKSFLDKFQGRRGQGRRGKAKAKGQYRPWQH